MEVCEVAVVTENWSVCRRDKLWISMEYCGGGSLQDIYHGNDSKNTAFWLLITLSSLVLDESLLIFDPFTPPVTGPLSESQIAYMSRETLQVTHRTHILIFLILHVSKQLQGKLS